MSNWDKFEGISSNYSLSLERIGLLDSFTIQCLQARVINSSLCKHHKLLVPGEFKMTPEEERFRDWYNGEKPVVAGMTDLELQAHIEDLSLIAYEARAKLTAAKDEQKERRAKNSKSRDWSVDGDKQITSDAINNINKRKEKLSKEDKMLQGLIALGMTEKEAREQMSAKALLDRMKLKQASEPVTEAEKVNKPFSFTNPFERKETVIEHKTEVSIVEESEVIIVKETETEVKPKFTFVNPFEKK